MVMFSHTLFSLPFAAVSMLWAQSRLSGSPEPGLNLPGIWTVFWIFAALVGARNGANALNRIIDRKIDELNPRTADRHIPSGKVSLRGAWILTILCFMLYIFSALMLNPLCAILSPVPLIIIFIYSYSKRFTVFCHIILGVACGAAPVGAWMAVKAEIGMPAFLLGVMVALWVAGFDIIYAIMDIEFDRENGLFSIPALLGSRGALIISAGLHISAYIIMIALHLLMGLGTVSAAGIVLSGLLLTAEHIIAGKKTKETGAAMMKIASYSLNQIIGVVYLVFNAGEMIL
jgi:4-hydroxybenzoate polyprenyltransferase